MIIFFLAFVLLCLYKVKFHKNLNEDYLSIENTQAIKGIFILLVFFSHFNSYVNFTWSVDSVYQSLVAAFGQTMVTLFLFYSGYGVMESINKKGKAYVKSIPTKRILSTLFKFDCAVIIFWVIGLLLGEKFSPTTVILALIGWASIGNSNWYIFVVLLLYLITYVSFRFLTQTHKVIPLILTFILTAGFILANLMLSVKPLFWIDTAFCYVLGMGYSLYRKRIEAVINKNNIVYCFLTVLSLALLAALKWKGSGAISAMSLNLIFTICVVLITMRVTLKNKILLWCGKHLFEIYILQRIPMIIFQRIGIDTVNIYLYFALCLTATILIVFPFKYTTDKAWGFLVKCTQRITGRDREPHQSK